MAVATQQQKVYIIKDRAEAYRDFTFNLLYYINQYYLDKECLYDEIDINNHFSWCFDKACNDFKEEGIDFSENATLKKYFYTYYRGQLYLTNKFNGKEDLPLQMYEKFWKGIFDFNKLANKSVSSAFAEIYNIFEKSINEKKY